ncbi:CbrC family protein [Streptomyces sp. NPDC055157]
MVPSDAVCICCGRKRGYMYTGPVYAVEDLTDRLCPWCIANGSVAERFDAHFTAGRCLGDDVPIGVFSAVDGRTPGFAAWQEPQWFFHCGDGAAGAAPMTGSATSRRVWWRSDASGTNGQLSARSARRASCGAYRGSCRRPNRHLR